MKFWVTLETVHQSLEVPVYAGTLEEALQVAEDEYMELGVCATRVRPDLNDSL
ncbi:inhibitor of host bacterial RNA polymerase [Pectobacterium phage Q19]|uniref:Inhibitor of host bacterial RNA polymerase n=1 Tax=Pectobacterium phage Q19 TaxID=2500576 RepID=A0A678ZNY6_9CAUD|nr:inhibitor of host bacterial RNA polymerase [Pectobacterium phage Q19]